MRLFPASATYRLPLPSTATPVGSENPELRLWPGVPGPPRRVLVRSRWPITRSANPHLGLLVPQIPNVLGFFHASTRLFDVSATYRIGVPELVSTATPAGFHSSRPSTRFGETEFSPDTNNPGWPNSREGS